VAKAPHLHPDQSPEEMAAQARLMAARRWRGTTLEDRRAILAAATAARWQGTTPEERSEALRLVGAHRRPGRRAPVDPSAPRCGCGRMTLARAEARADRSGTGLGHAAGCPFYRRQRRPGKRRPVSGQK
jgi:hypothetical protein